MKIQSLRDVFIHELKDLLSAEKQLTHALPKLAKAASHEELAGSFDDHLVQTERHIERLERIFANLGVTSRPEKCRGMEGIIAEGMHLIHERGSGEAIDALLISTAQRIEHYEIAGYGSARTFAQLLGEDEAVAILQTTLDEEAATDGELTTLALRTVNRDAAAILA